MWLIKDFFIRDSPSSASPNIKNEIGVLFFYMKKLPDAYFWKSRKGNLNNQYWFIFKQTIKLKFIKSNTKITKND